MGLMYTYVMPSLKLLNVIFVAVLETIKPVFYFLFISFLCCLDFPLNFVGYYKCITRVVVEFEYYEY